MVADSRSMLLTQVGYGSFHIYLSMFLRLIIECIGRQDVNLQYLDLAGNRAHDGGSLYIASANYGFSISSAIFEQSTAGHAGGSLFLASSNGRGLNVEGNDIIMDNCGFYDNHAKEGGGASVFYNNVVQFIDCVFRRNGATNSGAAMFVGNQNEVFLKGITVVGNIAGASGGGVFGDTGKLHFYSTRMSAKTCKEKAYIELTHPFLYIIENTFEIEDATFNGNLANSLGGALCFLNNSYISFFGAISVKDNSGFTGGGIAILSSGIWYLAENSTITLEGNHAARGSAMAMSDLRTGSFELHDLTMRGNVAAIAGTVYWLHHPGASSSEPQVLSWAPRRVLDLYALLLSFVSPPSCPPSLHPPSLPPHPPSSLLFPSSPAAMS